MEQQKNQQIEYWQLQHEEILKILKTIKQEKSQLTKSVLSEKQTIKQLKVKLNRTELQIEQIRYND